MDGADWIQVVSTVVWLTIGGFGAARLRKVKMIGPPGSEDWVGTVLSAFFGPITFVMAKQFKRDMDEVMRMRDEFELSGKSSDGRN